MVVHVCKQDALDIEKKQMLISLLFIMKISNRGGGDWGSRFFILTYVSNCNGKFSLILFKFQCYAVRSFECHGYSGTQRYLLAVLSVNLYNYIQRHRFGLQSYLLN